MEEHLLFDEAPAPLLVLDQALVVVAANRAWLAATGLAATNLIGRGAFDPALADDTCRVLRDAALRVRDGGARETVALHHLPGAAAAVEQRWQCTLVPISGHGDEVRGVMLLAQELVASLYPGQDLERLGALAQHLIGDDEALRERLARTLHDELGSQLTAAKLDLSWVRRQACAQDEKVQERLVRVTALLDEAIALKRRLIEGLRPSALAHLGLGDALGILLDEAGTRNGWTTHLDIPAPLPPLPDAAALALYRVAQQALDNVARHAGAAEVAIELTECDGYVQLTVRDDGRGLDQGAAARPAQGHGVAAMRQRLLAFGGGIELQGMPGTGTRLVAHLPLREGG
ncbi:hypothetical protein GCM10007860_31110 [Chitiniphilus shinanonensis]|uniref:histidine kinase n=1 Tax=Chitiniphilus shinanonensis TaxID=553088 RepID=A0ABQ6C0C1_9NEIS|nr:histidine kinase [Chitiniphilus shinanonensis]GLS05947.1 hypothetical protein GCM10007860_31110 [Chitiniphilus shinanonensis]